MKGYLELSFDDFQYRLQKHLMMMEFHLKIFIYYLGIKEKYIFLHFFNGYFSTILHKPNDNNPQRLREEQERVEKERKEKEKIKLKEERQKQREEARKIMRMRKRQEREHKRQEREHKRLQKRINMEERKILIARRKLESIRLFSELFNRIKVGFCC